MKKILSISRFVGGFTMIELLIVISILGILSVVVLAALNPLEQINRGRDTAARADAEQLISATERYAANKGYFPWQVDAQSAATLATFQQVTDLLPVDDGLAPNPVACPILEKLAQGNSTSGCLGSDELKATYIIRVGNMVPRRGLYIYNRGTETSDNTYVCFSPQSSEFETQAQTRCDGTMPSDIDAAAWAQVCPTANNVAGEAKPMICLP